MALCESLNHFVTGELDGTPDHPARQSSEWNLARRIVSHSLEQKQMFDRALLHSAIA